MCYKKNFLTSLVIFIGFAVSLFPQTNFVQHPGNPVSDGTPGEWDAFIILTGNVIYDDGKYHMYYCGQETPWGSGMYHMDIGYASSTDCINWEKNPFNPVFTYDRDGWEKNGFNDLTVLKIDNMWHMWYETLPTNYPNDHSFEIGYASSKDGHNWKRREEQLNIGADEGKWDSGTFTVQDVIYDGEKFLMYYVGDTTWENQAQFQVGIAESDDGITWTKDTLLNPIIMSSGNFGIWSLDVLFDSTNTNAPYQMWYTRYDNVNADKVFYAKSEDGKNWIEKEEPLFVCENFPWATLWPDDMEVCYVDGVYHMWLYGINSSYQSGIGAGVGYFIDTSNVATGLHRNENIPYKYSLAQNYPNPFNPSTTIKYQIPRSSVISNSQRGERSQDLNNTEIPKQVRDDITNVSLKIYDILGKEVATLVNEKQKPGYYEVDFNANGLASGIYFYKLSAGASTGTSAGLSAGSATGFVETKKMLLMK